ncbi:TolC family protein [Entomospira entomophila]|uniref:TolC family protein n=1 Tax=Entomospira entomophila TaxID=2719988 RepID=A0A968KRW2_9SPIO|nr:TolC family protein [Entomospira entomophilus]NIZ41129.1 TolC family protein [Entomospira entomophilus]WDI35336.1 TolC family protein [Entomospira entomophilus]
MKKSLWFTLALFCFAPTLSSPFAQTSGALYVDEAMIETLIISNNVSFKAIQTRYEQAKRARNSMWNEFLPQVSAGVSSNRVYGPDGLLAHGNTTGGWVSSVNFGARLDLTSWVWMGMLKTQYEFEAGELSYAHAKQQLISNGLIAFYGIMLERDSLQLRADGVKIAQEAYQQSLNRFNNGVAQQLEMLNAEVSYQNQNNQYEQAKISFEQSLLSFKQILGIPLDQEIILVGSIDIETYRFDTDQTITAFSGQNLALQQALKQQIANEWNLWFNHASATFRPFVSLDYSAQYSSNPMTHLTPTPSKARNSFSLTIGFTMQLDAFLPWSKTGLSLWQARDGFKLQALQNEDDTITNEREIIVATEKINNIVSRLTILQNAASVSARALELTRISFEQGMSTQLELDQALIRWNEAQLNLVSAKFDYFRALQELSITTGQSPSSLMNFARTTNQ